MNKKYISVKQWNETPKEYKSYIDGQHYILELVENVGTCLVPVELSEAGVSQKEGLKNILESFRDKRLAYKFLGEWLQDINWHTECKLLVDQKLSAMDNQYLDALETAYMVTHQSEYSTKFVRDLINSDPDLLNVIDQNAEGRGFYYKHYYITNYDLSEFGKTNFYRTFNYIYGWGMTTPDWNHTSGQELVDELIALVEESVND